MTDFTPDDGKPITVKATAGPVVMSETFKYLATAGFAVFAEHFIRTDLALGAVMACSGIVATWAWGLWHRLRTWGALRFLADHVEDHVAFVRK